MPDSPENAVLSHVKLPPSEAISYFRQKLNVPTQRWGELESAAHAHSFAIAGATSDALLNDFRTAVGRAIANGTTLAEFRKSFDSIVKKHGWQHTGKPGWRAEIIYQTNLANAYSAGRYRQMTTPAALELFPYWRYQHHECAHPRAQHLAWSGTVLRNDDPWWSSHYTPNGWRCHCTVEVVSQARLERNGWQVSESPPIETREWRNPATGRTIHVPVGIDPGFQTNPGLEWANAERARAKNALTPVTHVGEKHVSELPVAERQATQVQQIQKLARMRRPVGVVEAAVIPATVQKLLGSNTDRVLLSAETLLKNKTHHPEITPTDYGDLAKLIPDPDYVLEEKQEGRLTLLAGEGEPYRIVLKRTGDGQENFVLSVVSIRDRQLRQLLRNRRILFDKYRQDQDGE